MLQRVTALALALNLTGTGAAGATAPTTAEQGRPLYVAHRDSSDISIFTIGRSGGLSPVGAPVATGGEPPAYVFSADGRFAYVVNDVTNQITVYQVGAGGTLTPRFAPVDVGGDAPFGPALTPDGRFLYTANHDSGTISMFTVHPDGAITPLATPVPAVDIPRATAVNPNGRFLYVSHFTGPENGPGRLSVFAIRPDGTLEQRGTPISIGKRGAELTLTPDGRLLYVTAQNSGQVFGFAVDQDGGLTPVPGSPYDAGPDATGATVTPDGHHLYIISDAVHGFTIGPDGELTPVPGSPFPAGSLPITTVPTPDGRHLYVSDFDDNQVFGYDIASGGGLTQVPGSPFPAGGLGPGFKTLQVLPDQGPRAAFTAEARPAGQPSRFDATASTDPDGMVVRYDWNFGDGATATDAGPTPLHRYQNAGPFTVTVTVTDNEGCSAQLIFTGQSALCDGTSAARTSQTITVR